MLETKGGVGKVPGDQISDHAINGTATQRGRYEVPLRGTGNRAILFLTPRSGVLWRLRRVAVCFNTWFRLIVAFPALAWYTPAMPDPSPLPIPPPETIWPPAPLHNTVPPPLFVSAEGVEVTQSGGRLIAVNKLMKLGLVVELCVLSSSASSPWITFWTSPFHRHIFSAWLPYVLWSYRNNWPLSVFMLSLIVGVWYLFAFWFNAFGIVMDANSKIVKANGKLRPVNKIQAIRITCGQGNILGQRYTVKLIWNSCGTIPSWQKALVGQDASTSIARTSILGSFRQEANAEKIADAIAEFANVPIQHRTRAKNSV